MLRFCVIGAAMACLLPVASNAATMIDFETGYQDNDVLVSGTELLDSLGNNSGVKVVTQNGSMSVEASGSDTTAGFINDSQGVQDEENNGLSGLGGFFLRTTNALSGPNVNSVFSLDFGNGVLGVSGEIWDIDGNSGQGSEGWDVIATLKNGGSATQSSPILSHNQITGQNPTLDGLPWAFNFQGIGTITSLDFNFTGSKTSGIGTAVDNLSVAPVPLPAGGLLLLSGLGAAAFLRRKRA